MTDTGPWGAWVPGPACRREPTGSGALDGMRLAVKDLIDVTGAVTGGGNPDWAAGRGAAASDAAAVAVLRAQGARVVGKTVTDELAFSLEGNNRFYGTPRNPRAPGRLPGGSSSGSAVAVAAGLADVALGTDTGGSVRVPASFCGVYGMRPTHGRVSLQGVIPFAPSYDTVGWFAADPHTLSQAGRVLLGTADNGPLPALKVRVAQDALALADAEAGAVLQRAAAGFGVTGTAHAFATPWRDWLEAYAYLQGLEIRASLGAWIARARPLFGDNIAPRFAGALALDPARQAHWQEWRSRAATRLRQALGADDAWLVPAAPGAPLATGATPAQRGDFYERALALGSLAGHAGLPQVVMPLAQMQGLPLGVSLISGPGNDERLLALAQEWAAGTQGPPAP